MSNHNAARKAHRRPSFTFHAPARQENTKSGSLFVFGDSTAVEVESSDYEGIEMPIIHRRGTKPTTPDLGDQKSKFVFIHRDLAPTDTLASISLQYGCPVRFPADLVSCVTSTSKSTRFGLAIFTHLASKLVYALITQQ